MARIVVELQGKDSGLTSTLQKANTVSAQLGATTQKTSAILGGSLVKSSGNANAAILELSRGIQDAPFGSIGYINNLQQFQSIFGQLVKETGSAGSAFKALGSTLIGPAGLSVAFSIITAGIQIYSMWQQKSNKETQIAIDENKELAESIQNIEQVQAEGRKNASKDLSYAQTLYAVTQDLNQSNETRLKVAKELIKEYPTYLKGFDAEAIVAGKAAGAYERLTDAILAKGYAQAAEGNRQKLINQQLNANVDLAREQVNLTKLNRQIAQTEAGVNALPGSESSYAQNALERLKNQAQDSRNAITELNKTIANGRGEINLLDGVVKQLVKDFGTDVIFDPEKDKKGGKSTSEKIADLRKQLAELKEEFKETVTFAKASIGANQIDILDGFIKGLKEKAKKEFDGSKEPIIPIEAFIPEGVPQYVSQKLDETFYKIRDFSKQAGEVLSSGVANGIGDFAASIGNAIAAGDSALEAGGLAILSTIGSIATQLGKAAVSIGVGMIAIKKAFTNPLSAIAAGVALIAIGSFITGSVSKITQGENSVQNNARYQSPPGFAGGVTNFEGGLAYVHDGELLTNLPTGANVIPRAKTDRLLGSMGGGAGSWEVAGVLRGQDIEIAVRRTVSNNANI